MRNDSYDQQPTSRKTRDDRSGQTRLASRAIDCGHDCVHDGELEPSRVSAAPTPTPAAVPEPERTTR